jgi:membrane fusion protein, heavy metal efflux system
MKRRVTSGESRARSDERNRLMLLFLIPLVALAACEKRTTEATESTSYGFEGANAKAQLFTVPQEQMSHVEVQTVETMRLPRVLRLTGSVAYNGFETTPVITQVSGPVSRIVVEPGQAVATGQPMLYVSSPDYAQIAPTTSKRATPTR